MNGNNENRIGISSSPHEFTKVFKGQYNGIRFLLMHNKLYENDYGETDYSIEITWLDFLDEERQLVVNQAIIKLFNSKIEQKVIMKD